MSSSVFRISLRTRAIVVIAGFGLLAFAVFFSLAALREHHLLEKEVRHNYLSTARILADAIGEAIKNGDTSAIGKTFSTAQQDSDIVALVARDGRTKILTQWFDSGVENLSPHLLPFEPISQSQFLELGTGPSGVFHRAGHFYLINVPVNKTETAIGWLQICVQTQRLNQALASATYWGMRLLFAYFLLGALVIAFIDRRFRQSLSALTETIGAMAAGDLSRKVMLKTGDALERLGDQINTMAISLRERNQQVQEYQHNLEKMVAARTKTMRHERNKLRAILDHIPSGFLLLDENLSTVTASANFEKIFSRFGNHATHTRCGHGIWPVKDCANCPSAQALQQDRVVASTFPIHSIQGDTLYIEQAAIPIHRNGRIEGVLEMVTDVTERTATQEKLLKAERLAATSGIAAVIAHEARNSLTSVKMILQMLHEKSTKNAKSLRSIDVALDSVGHLEGFVNQLLQFTRPAPLVRRPCALPTLIDEVVELMLPEIASRKIELILKLDGNLPSANIDATRIKEAVINLLINAADSIDTDGKITIKLGCKVLQKEVRDHFVFLLPHVDETGEGVSQEIDDIVIHRGSEVIDLVVEDTGAGIPREIVPRIFEPFFTSKAKGTGLGLPLVRRIAHEHGGTVLYKPASNGGACFEIILPMS